MTPEAQRIAIAEACGWTDVFFHSGTNTWRGSHKDAPEGTWEIPDYLNDLNAMHEAEKHLGEIENWLRYDKLLAECGTKFEFHATAAQRAEAFLRTLNPLKE